MNIGYYNKTSIDSSINLGFYNKTSIDSSMNNNFYNKTYFDNSFSNITLSNYYTKGTIDSSINTGFYNKTLSDSSINLGFYNKTLSDASINLGFYNKTLHDTSMNIGYYNKTSIDLSVNTNFYNKTYFDNSFNNISLSNYYTKGTIDLSVNTNFYNKTLHDASMNIGYYNKTSIDLSVNTNFFNKSQIQTTYAPLSQPSFTTSLSVNNSSSNFINLGMNAGTSQRSLHINYIGTGTAADYGSIQAEHQGVAYRNLLLNPNGGSVGIGSLTAPSYTLDVTGTFRTTGNVSIETTSNYYDLNVNGTTRVNVANTTNNKLLVLWENTTSDPVLATSFFGFGVNNSVLRYQVDSTGSSHVFYAANTELMRMAGNGNVGIGYSTAPNYKLDVNGTGNFTGDVSLNSMVKINRISEVITTNAGTTSPYTFNYNTGSVFYISSPPATNFTVNITNMPSDVNRTFVVTLVINSATNKTYGNAFQIGGVAQTLIYNGGSANVTVSSASIIMQTFVVIGVASRVITTISQAF